MTNKDVKILETIIEQVGCSVPEYFTCSDCPISKRCADIMFKNDEDEMRQVVKLAKKALIDDITEEMLND